MAYFAELNSDNVVLRVISVGNSVVGEPDFLFPQTEAIGCDFIANGLGFSGSWKQTSYNNNFRKNYAGIGYSYDPARDAFIPPKPYPSWILSEESCLWNPPIPCPQDGEKYYWDEETTSWKEITNDPV